MKTADLMISSWWFFAGVPSVWTAGRAIFHVSRGRLPRFRFIVTCLALVFVIVQISPVAGGVLYFGICLLEFLYPYRFFSQFREENELESWGGSDIDEAQRHFESGLELADSGNCEDAELAFWASAAADPLFAAAWYWLGISRGRQLKDVEAVTALEELVRIRPAAALAHAALAFAYWENDNFAAAEIQCAAARKLNPWSRRIEKIGSLLKQTRMQVPEAVQCLNIAKVSFFGALTCGFLWVIALLIFVGKVGGTTAPVAKQTLQTFDFWSRLFFGSGIVFLVISLIGVCCGAYAKRAEDPETGFRIYRIAIIAVIASFAICFTLISCGSLRLF